MKKHALIYIGVLLLLLAAVTAFKVRPVEPEGSELYERCKDVPGVRVGFIKDYPVNDSVTCDVTTVEALTDEGWEWMLDSLGVRSMAEMDAFFDSIYLASGMSEEDCANTIDLWQSKRFHPEVQGDSNMLGNSVDCNLASPHYRWLTVYHATSDEELDAVINFHIKYQMEHPMTVMPTKGNTI
ncbi:MAG: hypothetical protein J6V98_03260 [Bacteroidales bacterium]|nr:hypothetical protein [Bacteroidales bacterium]